MMLFVTRVRKGKGDEAEYRGEAEYRREAIETMLQAKHAMGVLMYSVE